LHIFVKKAIKSSKIEKNIVFLITFMMRIRKVITTLQPPQGIKKEGVKFE